MIILTGYVAHMAKMKNVYRILFRKAVGGDHLGILACEGTCLCLTFIVWPLNPNVAANGQSYLKCPCLHPLRKVFFLLAVKSSLFCFAETNRTGHGLLVWSIKVKQTLETK
jgi:hypothetical protein